jgi:Na+/proline symporter
MADYQFLRLLRLVVLLFALGVLAFAIGSNASIYGMVESAYKITLVAAFVPLAAGLYWKRATSQGAMLGISAGLIVWISYELYNPAGFLPPQFAGFLAALTGMVVGSLLPQMGMGREGRKKAGAPAA